MSENSDGPFYPLEEFPYSHTSFLNLISDAIVIVSPDGKIKSYNNLFPSMLGLDFEIPMNMNLTDLLCDCSEDVYVKDIKKWEKGTSTHSEWSWTSRGEECVPTIVSARPFFDNDHKHTSTIVIVTDITLRKKAEEELREKHELYQALVHATPDGVILTDSSLNILMTNKQALSLFGLSEEKEALEIQMTDLVHPQQQELLFTYIEKIENGQPITYQEITLVQPKGNLIPIELSATSISHEKKLTGVVWYLRNLTEKYQAKRNLRESEQKFRSVFEKSPTSIFLLDSLGKITRANSAALDLLGIDSVEELRSYRIFEELDLDNTVISDLRRGNIQHVSHRIRFDRVRDRYFKSNRQGEIWVDVYIAPKTNPNGTDISEYIVHAIDVTEKRKAEESLKASEQLYRNIFAEAGIGIGYANQDRELDGGNSTFLDMLGYTEEELTKLRINDITDPEDMKKEIPILQEILEEKRDSFQIDKKFIRKDGSKFWGRTTISLMDEPGIDQKYLVGIVEDITLRREQKEALRNSEEVFHNIFDTIRYGIVYASLDGFIENANQAYLDMLGYTLEELREKQYQEFTPKRWADFEEEIVNEMIATGIGKRYEKEYIRKDGRVIPIEIHAWVMKDELGNPKRMFGLIRDITEEKREQNEWRELEEKYRIVVNTNPDAIALLNLNSEYLLVNKQLAVLHGFTSPEEMIGLQSTELIVEEDRDRALENRQRLLAEDTIKSIEYQLLRKDGSEFPALVNISLVRDVENNPSGFVAVVRDISHQKMTERKKVQSEHKFKTIFNASPVAMIVAGYDGVVREVNEAFKELFGYSEKEIRELKMHQFFSSPSKYQDVLKVWYKEKHVRDLQIAIKLSSGKEIPAQLNLELGNFEGMRVMIATFRVADR
ncbi:MAG: PAS domain S-box protein [Candidatus Lokiarchaeota archaeon]|nr:PAS domain S-box protein [Candidatus Lokiarchaeota archaeon]